METTTAVLSQTTLLGRRPHPIERIPSELLSEILSHLSTHDLLSGASTSRWWSEVTQRALYKDVTLRSSRRAKILLAQDHERGTKRPTRSLSLNIASCGVADSTAIINHSKALERLQLPVLGDTEEMIEILMSSGLQGLKHLSLVFGYFQVEDPDLELGTMPFATTLTSLCTSFVQYNEVEANTLRMLLSTISNLKEFHLSVSYDYQDQYKLVTLLASTPLSGLECLSLRGMELSTTRARQILSSQPSLRTFKSTLDPPLIQHRPSTLEFWIIVLPSDNSFLSCGTVLEIYTLNFEILVEKVWPGQADGSLKLIRLEGHFKLLRSCHLHAEELTSQDLWDEWRNYMTSYGKVVSKLEEKCTLNGVRLELD